MITKTKTAAAQFALISFEAHGRNMQIVAVGSESTMMAAHAETPFGGGTFYSVRPVGHELTDQAAKAEAAKLGSRQAAILRTFALATADGHGPWVKPGSRKSAAERGRWDSAAHTVGLAKAWDFTGTAKALTVKGLLISEAGKMAYAPKAYRMTAKGRLVAAAL